MKLDFRKIFVISILLVCIIAINVAVYVQITRKPNPAESKQEVQIDTALLTENFNNIFDNACNYQGNTPMVSKENSMQEVIYTSYTNQESMDQLYELNVHIPYLNINHATAKKINQEINDLFYRKANNILVNTTEYTIYSVKYKAYVNDNILSLIISATLKEGDNPQRVIMKTYNYNLSSYSELSLKEILQYRQIDEETVQNRVLETIRIASEDSNKYNELGYSKYLRNINSDIYQLKNTTVYFLGEEKALYIIYAYGNLNYTSEMDLVVI